MTVWDQAINSVVNEIKQPDSRLNLFDLKFPQQTGFIEDPYKRKALWCTRRAAKSYTAGLALADTVERYHEVNCLYLGLTKDSALGIIWKDILLKIMRDHELDWHPRESKRDITSSKSSTIYISGADADDDEMQKLLGKKYKLIIIDEAQAYSVDLRTLIYGILGPTTIDQGGTICMMGTAGNLTQGLFFDVTNGKEPGWKLFQWTAHDNPYVAKQWQEELNAIDRERPDFKKTALYKQWYLNQWVIDEDAKVYKFNETRDRVDSLPRDVSDWHYILGVDLAHSPDSTSFVVSCYHESTPVLYFKYAEKKQKMDITDVALFVKELEKKYKFDVKIVDGANKQAVAELNNRHGIGLIPADKTGKSDFIKIMNDEFIQGKIKLLPETEPLQTEYKALIWVTDANQKVIEPRKENPILPNDCCDAALYNWRYCYQYLWQNIPLPPNPNDQSCWEPAHITKLEDQVKQAQNINELDLKWNEEWDSQDEDI